MTIHDLVVKYEANKAYYTTNRYNETLLRSDFLDPLFELLGWDIKNVAGRSTNEREVILEEPLKADMAEHSKKPDYTFRLFAERKFFLEAKKPCIHIESVNEPAKQVRRYGFTADLRISVLSNFEYLMIYDTSVKVDDKDTYVKALIKKYHYTEYEKCFNELEQMLGKEAVYSGTFDEYWNNIEIHSKQTVDSLFLNQINEWRLMLGRELISADDRIDIEILNDIVQGYINKILFLRVCEDRNIEEYHALLQIANEEKFETLVNKFKQADSKYNSGLFKQSFADKMIGKNGSAFWTIIHQLYYPDSPYSFSVFSSDVLGHIYEIFLSQRLVMIDSEPCLVNKPENVNRDVVTTPTYIIREILRQTVTPLCKDKTDKQILEMKFADVACGSGAFLLETFQLLCDTLIDYYVNNDKSQLIQTSVKTYKLKYSIKKHLLTNCIYGVDKDFNAVEASKFGLLLKLLENEDVNTLIGIHPILPDLNVNIIYGNSLLTSDDIAAKDVDIINPFDFKNLRFDAVIGNPPYMKSEDMKNLIPLEFPLYKIHYNSAYKQFDKYFLFIERGLNLLKGDGLLGFIVPSKFMKVGAGMKLRKIIAEDKHLCAMTSFGANQVFADKTTYTCIIVLSKQKQEKFCYQEISNLKQWRIQDKQLLSSDIKFSDSISDSTWVLFPDSLKPAYERIVQKSITLSSIVGEDNIFNGIQTSANKIYIFQPTAEDETYYTFINEGKEYKIEKEVTKPYYKTVQGKEHLWTYRTFKPNARVIYPYNKKNKDGKVNVIPINIIEKRYPYLYAYLIANKENLCNPKRDIKPQPQNFNEWYRYGRHQSLEACGLPQKIIVGVLSTGDKYAIDTCGTLISSGGTAGYCVVGVPIDCAYSIYYLQAILNSKYLEWISSLYGEIFRGGYIARGTKVLMQLPIYSIDFDKIDDVQKYQAIVELQKQLIKLGDLLDEFKNNQRKLIVIQREFNAAKMKMEQCICYLYGMKNFDELIPSIKEQYATN